LSYLDAPEIDRSDPNRNKLATDSDRLLTAEVHCYLSAIPKPTVTWLKVSKKKEKISFSIKIQFFCLLG